MNQNVFCCPDNRIDNIVGVEVTGDPDDGYEETQTDHDGQELTSKERHDYDSVMAHDTILSSPRSLLLNRRRTGKAPLRPSWSCQQLGHGA